MRLIINKLPRITKNKKRLEKLLEVKITNRGKEVFVEGTPENEFVAEKVLLALDFGFPFSHTIVIKKQECDFVVVNLKDYFKSNNHARVRGRVIGKNGKTLKRLSQLTDCFLEIKDNEVGIIGLPENIINAQRAIIDLVRGAKHGNVYRFLQENKFQEPVDLGLKKDFQHKNF